jgi:hypothetical protein
MKEENEQTISEKIEELKKDLKIRTEDEDWLESLDKELKSITTSYKISRAVGFLFMGGFAILGLVALIADDGSVLGIEIKNQYLYVSIIVTSISSIILNAGNSRIRMDRIKTFLFLNDLESNS